MQADSPLHGAYSAICAGEAHSGWEIFRRGWGFFRAGGLHQRAYGYLRWFPLVDGGA
jgi:hypothetical protein